MNPLVAFWLGGAIAVTILLAAHQFEDGDAVEAIDFLGAVFWPLLLPWYLFDTWSERRT